MNVKNRRKIVVLRRIFRKSLPWLTGLLIASFFCCLSIGGVLLYRHITVDYAYGISTKLYCKVYRDGSKAIASASSNRNISRRYVEVIPDCFGENVVYVRNKKLKEGFVSPVTGELIVPCRYNTVWPSGNGSDLVACCTDERVLDFWNVKTGVKAFTIHSGAEWCDIRLKDEHHCRYIQFNGKYCIVPMMDKEEALVDSTGKIVMNHCEEIVMVNGFYIVKKSYGNFENRGYESAIYEAKDLHCLLAGMDSICWTDLGFICCKDSSRFLMDSALAKY